MNTQKESITFKTQKKMKYVSIDIETTGLDPERNDILSVGLIIEDTENKLSFEEIPKLHIAIKHQEVTGSLFAINMNKELIGEISRYQSAKTQDEKNDLVNHTGIQFLDKDDVVESIFAFFHINGITSINSNESNPMKNVNGKMIPMLTSKMKPVSITVAGKNFGTFDKLFLERLPRWQQAIRVKQRMIDPGILFVDWKSDDSLPSLEECKKRGNIEGVVTHDALEDAWDVILLLRKFY